jgi:Rieske Fe-S protein
MNSEPRTGSTSGISRRRFFDYVLGTSIFATLAAILYPIFRFMVPPKVVEAQQNSVVAGKVNEIPVNSGRIFKFGSKPGLLVRTETGDVKAFSASCTHLDCIVQYDPKSKQIICACHNGAYDLTGKNVSGPPPRPLDEYVVKVSGDDITVTKT